LFHSGSINNSTCDKHLIKKFVNFDEEVITSKLMTDEDILAKFQMMIARTKMKKLKQFLQLMTLLIF